MEFYRPMCLFVRRGKQIFHSHLYSSESDKFILLFIWFISLSLQDIRCGRVDAYMSHRLDSSMFYTRGQQVPAANPTHNPAHQTNVSLTYYFQMSLRNEVNIVDKRRTAPCYTPSVTDDWIWLDKENILYPRAACWRQRIAAWTPQGTYITLKTALMSTCKMWNIFKVDIYVASIIHSYSHFYSYMHLTKLKILPKERQV